MNELKFMITIADVRSASGLAEIEASDRHIATVLGRLHQGVVQHDGLTEAWETFRQAYDELLVAIGAQAHELAEGEDD